MSENNLRAAGRVLRASSAAKSAGILGLSRGLRVGPSKLIRLVAELRNEGLLSLEAVRTGRAGRPRLQVRPTPLGEEFLRAYNSLLSKPLRSRPSDLRRAAADAEYASRLDARRISPYALFLELNSLASDAGSSAV